MFLNILHNAVLIVFVLTCAFFTLGVDKLLYKLKRIKIDKIFTFLTIICICIEIALLLMYVFNY